jgi:Tol biopolymer transport system component
VPPLALAYVIADETALEDHMNTRHTSLVLILALGLLLAAIATGPLLLRAGELSQVYLPLLGAPVPQPPPGTTSLVSVATDGTPGNYGSESASIAAGGRHVAFASWANNLVPGDTNAVTDIFVRDLEMRLTTRVSIASNGQQANGHSSYPVISADGRYIAFESSATNLVPDDTNNFCGFGLYPTDNCQDIFVHDRQTGETTLVSRATGGLQANYSSHNPAISADGRFVAFSSYANNLTPDSYVREGIYVHDRLTGETTRVSVASDGTPANEQSLYASISADGRLVAFASSATNLIPDGNLRWDIYVHDRESGQTAQVSVASDGTVGNNDSMSAPSISADGRYVVFSSYATNLVPGDTNAGSDIFVHDRITGLTTRVSVATGGIQASSSYYHLSTAISATGRFVVFESDAPDLVPGDTNYSGDIFIHDLQTVKTIRVSVSTSGEQGDALSAGPSISGDGRFVVFISWAHNLIPNDTLWTKDVYLHSYAPD